jgi:hypothetical protein
MILLPLQFSRATEKAGDVVLELEGHQALKPEGVVRLLRSEVDSAGGQAAWARKHRVDLDAVNKTLRGQRAPSKTIINALKLCRVFISDEIHEFKLEDVVRLLRSEADRAGGQSAWARKARIDRTVVNQVCVGRQLPCKAIVKALKLRVAFVYEPELRTASLTLPAWPFHRRFP